MLRVGSLILLFVLAACGSKTSYEYSGQAGISGVQHPPLGPAQDVGCGTVAFDLQATPAVVASGTTYVLHYMQHWAPYSPQRLNVVIVPRGTLFVGGFPVQGNRILGTGAIFVTHDAQGQVFGSEWEIPLETQNQVDPGSWTWGTWGPLYPGQTAAFAAATR